MTFDVTQAPVSARMSSGEEHKKAPEMSPEGLQAAQEAYIAWLATIEGSDLSALDRSASASGGPRPFIAGEPTQRFPELAGPEIIRRGVQKQVDDIFRTHGKEYALMHLEKMRAKHYT